MTLETIWKENKMADIVSSSWNENTMNISEMSYDEYCILAFGKDVDELREESKPLKEKIKEE